MSVTFTDPSPLKTILPWTVTVSLLLVWGAGALTGDRFGGAVDGFLIAGAGMALVSLILGRKLITHSAQLSHVKFSPITHTTRSDT